MKLIFPDPTLPLMRFKCGASEILAGSILTGGLGSILSAGSTISTNETNESIARGQINAQKEENQLNRDWQTAEAEKNRQFEQEQVLQAQQYQSEQWEHQFNQELSHRFDIPAGINPAVYYSSKGAASSVGSPVSAPSPAHGSMPGSVGGLSPVPFQAQRFDIPQLMTALGSMFSGLADAQKSGAETQEIMSTLQSKIRSAIANSDTAESMALMSKLNVELQKSSFPIALKRAAADYEKVVSEIELNKQKGLSEKSIQSLNSAHEKLMNAMENLNSKQAEKLGLEMPYVVQYMTSSIKESASRTAENYASAESHKADAALTRWQESFNRSNNDIIVSKLDQELRNLEKEGSIMDWQVDAAKAAAKIAEVNADHAEALFWKDFIMDIVTNGFDAFLGYKNSKSWERLSKSSQLRAESRIKEIEMQYGDSYTDEYSAFDSQGNKHTYKAKYHRGRASKVGR